DKRRSPGTGRVWGASARTGGTTSGGLSARVTAGARVRTGAWTRPRVNAGIRIGVGIGVDARPGNAELERTDIGRAPNYGACRAAPVVAVVLGHGGCARRERRGGVDQ